MTGFGTARRETTKMIDTKHPEYDHERPDQSEIPLQSGTNKFASQKGMTGFGTNRRETSKIVDTAHPEYDPETSIDATSIPYQMGSNKYASQKGMTGFGQPRWEVLDPSISWQNRKSQGMVRLQSGTNRFASQAGMIGFGTVRNTTYVAEAGELPYEDMKKSEAIIPSQAGWNKGDSQKGYTSFGAPRDVRGDSFLYGRVNLLLFFQASISSVSGNWSTQKKPRYPSTVFKHMSIISQSETFFNKCESRHRLYSIPLRIFGVRRVFDSFCPIALSPFLDAEGGSGFYLYHGKVNNKRFCVHVFHQKIRVET